MSKDQQDATAEASLNNPPSNEPQNVGYEAFFSARVQEPVDIPEEEPPAEATEEIPQEAETPPEEESPPAEQEGIAEPEDETTLEAEDVLSQLESLSDEDRKRLAKEIGSRSADRISKLVAQRNQERDARLALEREKAEKQTNPFEETEIENNPFEDLNTFDELKGKAKELKSIDEWADNLLWEHGNADPDEVIVSQGGEEFTKKAVRELQMNARKGIEQFLPSRLDEIKRAEYFSHQEKVLDQKLEKDLPWIAEKDHQTYKAYESTLQSPVVQEIREKVPSIAPMLNSLIAHAVNSMSQNAVPAKKQAAKEKAAATPAKPPRPNPPSNPTSNAGMRPATNDENMSKQLKNLQTRYQETGSVADHNALRAAQIAQNR